jgi:DNA-binding transcriptional regulator GbsR (MarR family)
MQTEREKHFIEEFGLLFDQMGLPRTAGRIMAWLLVCEPPHQTMDELTEALGVSKSAISTTVRMLIQIRLVERISLPGERKDHYRISDDAWTNAWHARMAQVVVMRQVAERGLSLLPEGNPARRKRLETMRDMYAFFERELPLLLDRWLAEQAEKDG